MSQILWLIVAGVMRSLVYHIPDCKLYLGSSFNKMRGSALTLQERRTFAQNENARPWGRASCSREL
ncbi:hypothetical protein CVM73_01950 [Bradyrhizobium forestalis]|uniref:Uncharacterized protein n=1 Tax=Bradyrhizobium forestalis TaxID=1419263 RepID=A0A2M8RH86_9BRAD|nr:hypothetical protein CVM73_01950 [Bradyrhizobium forestalis]